MYSCSYFIYTQNAKTQILIFLLKIVTLVIPSLDYGQLGSAEFSPDSAVNDHSVAVVLSVMLAAVMCLVSNSCMYQ